jgi:hypothetical protein
MIFRKRERGTIEEGVLCKTKNNPRRGYPN